MWNTRDLSYAVHLYLDANNISHTYTEETSSKVTDQMKLALSNLKTPNTWYCSVNDISPFVKNIEKVCKYPMVIKDTRGSKGIYASFISGINDLISTRISLPETKKYLIQEYIPNDYEWGVLVVNNAIVSAEKSYPKPGEFRNNFCNGAKEVFISIDEIPKNIQKLILDAAKILNLPWCRVDVLEDKNTGIPYVLEVNRFPDITIGSNEVTAAEKYLKSIL